MVQLIIKSAAQSVEDFSLTCDMTWTIAQVKDQISALYPTQPKKEHQKLIYGGKLLPDDLTLKSILNQVQDIYVLHLVCPPRILMESEKKDASKQTSVPPVCTVPPSLSADAVYTQMNQPLLTPSTLPSGSAGISNVGVIPGSDAFQQYFAMQQMYTQLMSQYFAQYTGSVPHTPTAPPMQQQPPPPQMTPPQRNAAPNAQRQPDEEEDYIDYVYAFVRILILSSLLVYYSSFTRVVAVTLMVMLITMFARINRQHQREQLQRARQASENTQAATQQNPSNDQNDANENQVSDEDANTESTSTNTPAPAPNSPSVPSIIFSLVTAFFASLVPSDPLPVNVN